MTHQQRHQSLGIHSAQASLGANQINRLAMLNSSRRWGIRIVGALLCGLVLVMLFRFWQGHVLHEATERSAKTHVTFVLPKKGAAESSVELPATLQGFEETPIYSRSAGYVSKWYKDIGDHVKAGEVLATIAAPEVERELAQAQAAREQAQSALELARTTDERWRAMRQKDAVSQQDFDERHNAFRAAQANFDGAQANVQRLEKFVGYAKIVAPFTGVITKRNVDVGTLVDVGNGGAAKVLFGISHTEMMRLYVAVPQMYAQGVKVGAAAGVRLTELPGQVFEAKVVRASGGIDPVTRTLQVEVDLPNNKGLLMSGAYATVSLTLTSPASQMLTVPNNALLFRPEGVFVVVVQDDTSHLKPVKLGRDLGTRIQIVEGLDAQDQVVINPPDAILDGQALVATAWKDPKAATAAAVGASAAASAASSSSSAAMAASSSATNTNASASSAKGVKP
jgi:membrane fusion protein, multidrug efflux system